MDKEVILNQVQDAELESFKMALLTKGRDVQNASRTTAEGYGVPTAVGGDIIRIRNRKSYFRRFAKSIKVNTITALTFNPNGGAAGYITGAYTDLNSAGTLITATPAKMGGKYSAKEEVNDFSVLNVIEQFKIDAGRALVKGENTEFMNAVIAKASTLNVASGAWTQAKLAEVISSVGGDYLGGNGAFFINPVKLPALMAVQTNGAGSPMLFTPEYNAEDSRVGTLFGQPVFVSSQVASGATGKLLWYVAGDAVSVVDFAGGELSFKAGESESTNDLYINFKEYVYFSVDDPNGVVSLTF